MNDNYNPSREAFVKTRTATQKIKNNAKTARRRRLILSSKKLCMAYVIRAAALSAWREKEGGISIYNLLHHLPLTTNHHDPEKQPIPLQLPEWRALPYSFKAAMYQLALSHLEQQTGKQLIPFVWCCSQLLTDKAAQQRNEAAYLSTRLKDGLHDEFDAVPEYWLSLEMAPTNGKGFAHIQGSILLSDSQIRPFKTVLHKLNGKVPAKFKNYAVRTRESRRQELIQKRGQLYTDINWAFYNTKESGRVGYQFTRHRRNIAVRQDLTRLAKQMYQELREAHLS
jgi:hypothetical protein